MKYPSIPTGFKTCLSFDYKFLYSEMLVTYRVAALKTVGVISIILAI